MEKCIHCGNDIVPGQTICFSCGCRCLPDVNITLKRRKAFTGSLAVLSVQIIGNDFDQKVLLSNGAEKSITIPSGDYLFKVSFGGVTGNYQFSVNQDTAFEVYVKLGMFSNKLIIEPISS